MSDRSATAVVAVRIRHVESVADKSVQVHIRATPSMGPTDRMAGMDFGGPTLIAGGSSCLFRLPGQPEYRRLLLVRWVTRRADQFERAYNKLGDIRPEWNVPGSRLITQDALVTPLPPSDLPTPCEATRSLSNGGDNRSNGFRFGTRGTNVSCVLN